MRRRVRRRAEALGGAAQVFLVHALLEPYPRRGETVSLPLPTLSVRGDFERQDFWMFDCSDIHGRRVAHAVLAPRCAMLPRRGHADSVLGEMSGRGMRERMADARRCGVGRAESERDHPAGGAVGVRC